MYDEKINEYPNNVRFFTWVYKSRICELFIMFKWRKVNSLIYQRRFQFCLAYQWYNMKLSNLSVICPGNRTAFIHDDCSGKIKFKMIKYKINLCHTFRTGRVVWDFGISGVCCYFVFEYVLLWFSPLKPFNSGCLYQWESRDSSATRIFF